MLGLAQMAARLAQRRISSTGFAIVRNSDGAMRLSPRYIVVNHPQWAPRNMEYYEICDRISRGEKP